MSESNENGTSGDSPIKHRIPSLLRNYISFVGTAIVTASLASVVLLFAIEITSSTENPYIGILTYIIFPSILIFGIFVMVVGALFERRRRRRSDPDSIMAYPKLDLNDAQTRRSFMTFLVVTFFFVAASAFGSYRAFEYTESVPFCGQTCHTVMKPEFIAYQAGAHARVTCVQCHVGSGAGWYARSKLSGAYQLYSVAFNKYSRPIKRAVHNLRPLRKHVNCVTGPKSFRSSNEGFQPLPK
ncbi:MAG: NapC/NirT family cytochrome c [Chloracidobacterium sp.]|nr:NapC/NirT family cytochrome c [Chloracidobacterium sp.]